jgi:hypothetical protein
MSFVCGVALGHPTHEVIPSNEENLSEATLIGANFFSEKLNLGLSQEDSEVESLDLAYLVYSLDLSGSTGLGDVLEVGASATVEFHFRKVNE